MGKTKSLIKAVGTAPWFFKASWRYATTRAFSSKLEYVAGVLPAWVRFTVAMYKDCRSA
jgi:hypothetical protein